jgi:hypothetical protein
MHGNVQLVMLAMAGDGWKMALAAGWMHLSQAAGAVLITAIWQSAVVATCLGLSLRINKRVPAGLRFGIWAGGFVAALGLPFLPMLARTELWRGTLAGTGLSNAHSWLQLDVRWSIALALAWATASVYRAVDLAVHAVKLRRLWQSATALELDDFSGLKLRGRKPVKVCTSSVLDRPSVIGFFAPRILIPTWLCSQITREELDQIVLHEMEHLRRGDDWTNLLQKLGLVLFPLNPVLLWMERRLCLEREMACDEAVVQLTRAPKAYAACLTSLAERGLEQRMEALTLGAWQRKPELVQRVHSILMRRKLLGPLGRRGVAVLMAGGLLMGTVELARCPQLITFTAMDRPQLAAQAQLHAADEIGSGGDSVYRDSPQAVPVNSTGMGNARMVELRATMPIRAGVPFGASTSAPHRTMSRQRLIARAEARSRQNRLKQPSQPRASTTLKADLGNGRPFPVQEPGFVVFTAWEEVVPENSDNGASAAVESSNSVDAQTIGAAGKDSVARKAQAPDKVMVTQYVFRVVPASYRSGSQAIVPLRNGWLILQL